MRRRVATPVSATDAAPPLTERRARADVRAGTRGRTPLLQARIHARLAGLG
jgi:hypothetical protein